MKTPLFAFQLALSVALSVALSGSFSLALAAVSLPSSAHAQAGTPETSAAPESIVITGDLEVAPFDFTQLAILLPDLSKVELAAHTCVSNRGLTLSIPEVIAGSLTDNLVIKRNATTLLSVASDKIADLTIEDGKFSFKGQDDNGKELVSVAGTADSSGRYSVVVRRPGFGMMGYRCQ